MRLAIMQPYLFPYLGYFQLIHSADKFVVYDDVNFIRQGWINRNYMLLNGGRHLFTIPLASISSFLLINKVKISEYPLHWQRKLLQTFRQAYKKAPYFDVVFPLVETVIQGSEHKTISEVAFKSVAVISDYLGIDTKMIQTSAGYQNNHLKSAERIIDICTKENADTYINAIGGAKLYEQKSFAEKNIKLKFLQTSVGPYPQFANHFVADLSVIDVLMFNPVEKIMNDLLPNYSLI